MRVGADGDLSRPHEPLLRHQLMADALADIKQPDPLLLRELPHHLVHAGCFLMWARRGVVEDEYRFRGIPDVLGGILPECLDGQRAGAVM
jgi:hypothetical protein